MPGDTGPALIPAGDVALVGLGRVVADELVDVGAEVPTLGVVPAGAALDDAEVLEAASYPPRPPNWED
jgi:hypothetical protein